MKTCLFVIGLAFGISLPGAALACSCQEDKSVQAHTARADAIFEGEVTKSQVVGRGTLKFTNAPDYHYDMQGTDFRVVRVWIGDVPRVVQLQHSANAGCDLSFEVGKVYKVFARRQEDGTLSSDFCLYPYITESIEGGWADQLKWSWSDYEAVLGPPKEYE